MKYLPFPAIPPNSCIILPPILQFDHFSAFSLDSDDSRQYPMHMRLDGASKTLIRLIEGVFPIFDLIQSKNTCRQQSDRYSAPEPPTTPAPPPNESAESADEVGCGVAAPNGGRSLMNEAGGRFTHGCLVGCGVLTVVFLVQNSRPRKWKCSPAHLFPACFLAT